MNPMNKEWKHYDQENERMDCKLPQPVKSMGPFQWPKSAEPELLPEFEKELYDRVQETKRRFFAGFPDIQEVPEKKEEKYKLIADSFTFYKDYYEPGDWLEWLVAIGPEGMIMAEEQVSFREIYNGKAILEMEQKMLEKYDIASFHLSYYWADGLYAETYHRYLRDHPEEVYLTREELEGLFWGEGFTEAKVSIQEEHGWKPRTDRRYRIKLEVNANDGIVNLPGRDTNEIIQYFPDYSGMLGEDFMFRSVARQVNQILQNTEYADEGWCIRRDEEKDECIAIKIGRGSSVRLTIASETMK